jgi:hypothetical protein
VFKSLLKLFRKAPPSPPNPDSLELRWFIRLACEFDPQLFKKAFSSDLSFLSIVSFENKISDYTFLLNQLTTYLKRKVAVPNSLIPYYEKQVVLPLFFTDSHQRLDNPVVKGQCFMQACVEFLNAYQEALNDKDESNYDNAYNLRQMIGVVNNLKRLLALMSEIFKLL